MKKRNLTIVVGLVLALSMLAGSTAFAKRDCRGDEDRGRRGYNCWSAEKGSDVNLENLTKFKKETLELRDQLLIKKLELNQEYAKEKPDADVVAKLRKEIVDIQTSIAKVAANYGFEDYGKGKRDRSGSGRGNGDCGRGCL